MAGGEARGPEKLGLESKGRNGEYFWGMESYGLAGGEAMSAEWVGPGRQERRGMVPKGLEWRVSIQ